MFFLGGWFSLWLTGLNAPSKLTKLPPAALPHHTATESTGDSRMRQLNSGIGAHFRNSYFEQLNSRIERIPTLLGTFLLFFLLSVHCGGLVTIVHDYSVCDTRLALHVDYFYPKRKKQNKIKNNIPDFRIKATGVSLASLHFVMGSVAQYMLVAPTG